VLLMDIAMAELNGIEATEQVRTKCPNTQVVMLSMYSTDEYIARALQAGAIGYVLKDVSGETLFAAVRAAARGESLLPPTIAAKIVAELTRTAAYGLERRQPLADPLSERELEIVRLLARGSTNREIAATLILAEGTVKNHLTNILGKLGARDRAQAALIARDLGII
jgi:DNA-binding NarL/FixJ family response regulator